MKKLAALSVAILLVLGLMCGCGKKEKQDAFDVKSVAGKYTLTSLEGFEDYGVTADVYEYNYIELNQDGTYHLENKANDSVVEQSGKFTVDEKGSVVFSESDGQYDYLLLPDETAVMSGDTLTISGSAEGVRIKMAFTRE